ncbi:alpha/beta hydrolase [Bradyrhizobium sp. 41S5]|uniref:alpha/beta hydrolase n=1 Tax=Bradyrhizobium sp. 41S5 TaxID=1404443 RepID=UPI001E5A73B6|nr:alpha/beta hydrolase [Bradyrhizobium sp. 41S5]UFX49213.1 alpha/beta hydrolase [Bradyrhizobium sp. 41S5]
MADTVAGTSRVPVLVATTRQRSAVDKGEMFSGNRGDAVSYAAITVSIPPDSVREIGQIQWPSSIPGDPHRDFVTLSADYIDKPAFMNAITAEAKQRRPGKALIFVHGFNNKFDDAVYRFAQIVHDSRAPGIPVLFTWPSRGELKLRAYTYDRESANYSRDALEELIDSLDRNPNVSEINILAHSMGNWVALEALRSRYIRPGRFVDKLKNVMLVAPDVDVDVFRTQIRRMGTKRPRFALFVSQDDGALALSKTIWGGVTRLGEVNPEQDPYRTELAQDQIEVFDLTTLKRAGDDAHDRAFSDVTSVVGMIKQRLQDGQPMTDTKSMSMDRGVD